MKRVLIVCLVGLTLMVSPCFAIQYCKDFLESGNPGGWSTSLKTFDDEWTMSPGETVDLDIWINDLPEALSQAGFYITYDPSKVSIVSVDGYGSDLPGPFQIVIKEPDWGGPGTYLFLCVGFSPVYPDAGGDIIIAKIRFHCEAEGDAHIAVSTDPTGDTIVGEMYYVYDPEILPNMITIHQFFIDNDGDGILDSEDNCPNHPNGPILGTCTSGPKELIGVHTCTGNADCDPNGFCSKNQEDIYPPGGNGIGDACECEGDLDCDGDQDGSDAAKFKEDFGRSSFNNPCPACL